MKKKKKSKPQNTFFNFAICIFCLLIIAVSMAHITKNIFDVVKIQQEINQIDKQISSMQYDIEKISNSAYKDKLIRQEFLLSKPDELLFILPGEENGVSKNTEK
jgi:cell division protein FtsB